MKFAKWTILGMGMAALLALPGITRADDTTNATPDFSDVRELIRAHLAGENDADLNRDAVQGLLRQLHSRVSLVAGKSAAPVSSNAPVLAKSMVYDGTVIYLRVGRVGAGLAEQIKSAEQQLANTNHVQGIVLDLRFADGQDYAAAAATADLFFTKERPLLDWGNGLTQSKAKTNALSLPVVVLVNQKTAAAAEALAAVLRDDERAILLGSTTAGEATMSQDFPLKNGQFLRIATAAIKLGNGETLSTKGVKPDIQVFVDPADEQAYYADPFKEITPSRGLITSIVGEARATNATNRVGHPRQLNEAELMRERKEKPGVDVDDLPLPSGNDMEVEKPVIHDPVLGRALDLIKGIAALHRSTTP